MEPKGSLPWSQRLETGPSPELMDLRLDPILNWWTWDWTQSWTDGLETGPSPERMDLRLDPVLKLWTWDWTQSWTDGLQDTSSQLGEILGSNCDGYEGDSLLGYCAVKSRRSWPTFQIRLDDGGSKHLWNVGQLLRDYTAQYPRRLSPSSA
jgi:hypothetical protein